MRPEPEVVEVAEGWVAKARDDLAAAELVHASGRAAWIAGFHAQQAVEKSLKAQLVLLGVMPPRTHDLGKLRDLMGHVEPAVPLSLDEFDALRPFAAVERYPALRAREVAPDEVAPLVASARAAVAWIGAVLGSVRAGGN